MKYVTAGHAVVYPPAWRATPPRYAGVRYLALKAVIRPDSPLRTRERRGANA